MSIKFLRLSRGYYTPAGWKPAFLIATCDDHRVRCIGNGKGWDCACPNPECDHIDQVAEMVHPDFLTELELDCDHHLRPSRGRVQQERTVRRRRRVSA